MEQNGEGKSANGQDSKKRFWEPLGFSPPHTSRKGQNTHITPPPPPLSPLFRKCRVSSARVLNLGGLPFPHLINMGHPKAPFLFLLSLSPREGRRRREICSGDGHGADTTRAEDPPSSSSHHVFLSLGKKKEGGIPKHNPFFSKIA